MNLWFFFSLIVGTADTPNPTSESIDTKPTETTTETTTNPNIELLLFLAEWEDSDNNQWLDPEIFATDNSMTQQLDTQKAEENETDPDHN